MKVDLVTGAFSHLGSRIAELLLDRGHEVRSLTFHPDREHGLRRRVEALPYTFDDPVALAASLEGVTTLYNTYWVRFDRGSTTFANAVANSRTLFHAARRAGVERIVHVSISNPSIASALPYFRGKAMVERALAEVGVPYAIVRPTWIFGGERDVLANNIAWVLRQMPVFALPGDGRYLVQPVHIDDVARLCVELAAVRSRDRIVDAAGPETMTFGALVDAVRRAVGSRAPVVHVPPLVMAAAAQALGLVVGDIVLTPDEIRGLTAGLLVSSAPPLGELAFTSWLSENAGEIGRSYANELERHFRFESAAGERVARVRAAASVPGS
jgi:nucleoside-diphosphate-sugar epimerase